MTASALACPLATLNAVPSSNAAGPRPLETATPGAFARELEQAEVQARPDLQMPTAPASSTPISTPISTPNTTGPLPALPRSSLARAAAIAARALNPGPADRMQPQDLSKDARNDSELLKAQDDIAAEAGMTDRIGLEPTRSGTELGLRLQVAAVAVAKTATLCSDDTVSNGDPVEDPSIEAAELEVGIARDLGNEVIAVALMQAEPEPVSATPAAELLSLAAPAWTGQTRLDTVSAGDLTQPPATADRPRAVRPSPETLSLAATPTRELSGVPLSPTPDARLLPLVAPSPAAPAQPDGGPTDELIRPPAAAAGARLDRTLTEAFSLGSAVVAKPARMPLHPGTERTERTERPALAIVERDLHSGLPTRAGPLPAAEGADARLQAFVPALVVESPTSPAGEPNNNQALPPFAAHLLRASPSATAPQGSLPTATELNLPTPVNAPEFVPRLCGELAVLARGGVQEARVQVNPLELGPIAVQITLEGSHAQVHLAVDNAQTRALLEQSMPSLAAALRENGLTLTGGGVFQQARQNPREAEGPATRGLLNANGETEPGDVAAVPTGRTRHLGVLDTYA